MHWSASASLVGILKRHAYRDVLLLQRWNWGRQHPQWAVYISATTLFSIGGLGGLVVLSAAIHHGDEQANVWQFSFPACVLLQSVALQMLDFSQRDFLGGSPLQPHQLPAQAAVAAAQAEAQVLAAQAEHQEHEQLLGGTAPPPAGLREAATDARATEAGLKKLLGKTELLRKKLEAGAAEESPSQQAYQEARDTAVETSSRLKNTEAAARRMRHELGQEAERREQAALQVCPPYTKSPCACEIYATVAAWKLEAAAAAVAARWT